MPYSQSTVLLGGLMHIPILIVVIRLIENRFKINQIKYQNNLGNLN